MSLLVRNWTLRGQNVAATASKMAMRFYHSKHAVSAAAALANVALKGATVAIGGFGQAGVPETLIHQLLNTDNAQDLTVVAVEAGPDGFGVNNLVASKQAKKVITSYVGGSKTIQDAFTSGNLELDLVPQGTLTQRLKAAGNGTDTFFSRTGANTLYSQGGIPMMYSSDGSSQVIKESQPKKVAKLQGTNYVIEESLPVDIAFIKAWKADTNGNLVFHSTASNCSLDMAKSAKFCIVEAEEIVPAGELGFDEIDLRGNFVDLVVHADQNTKAAEKLAVQDAAAKFNLANIGPAQVRIMNRLQQEFKDGMIVHLGRGLPFLAPSFVPDGIDVAFQAENGLVGAGVTPHPNLDNASSANSSNNNNNHLTVLGGLQVSSKGDLANWLLPGDCLRGMGGAMDLACPRKDNKVVVVMNHLTDDARPRIVEKCTFPLSGTACVDMIITDLAVFKVDSLSGLTLMEIAPNTTVEDVKKVTGCDFQVAEEVSIMQCNDDDANEILVDNDDDVQTIPMISGVA